MSIELSRLGIPAVSGVPELPPDRPMLERTPSEIINMPIEDDDSIAPVYCEPLAGRCQQIETCLSCTTSLIGIAGSVYSFVMGYNVIGGICVFVTISSCVTLISNKTCGSLPRIHREFTQAIRKLEKYKQREIAISNAYQRQIDNFSVILRQNKQQIETLKKLSEESKTTSEQMAKNLDDLKGKYEGLLTINADLKKSTFEKKEITQTLQQNIELFSKNILDFKDGIDAIVNEIAEIKGIGKGLGDSKDLIGEKIRVVNAEVKTMSDQFNVSGKTTNEEIAENERLKAQIQILQQELNTEKQANEALMFKNTELSGLLKSLNAQLSAIKLEMQADATEFKGRKEAIKKEQAELEALRKSIQEASEQVAARAQCCQLISQTHEQLNQVLQSTNASIQLQIQQLKSEKSDDHKSNRTPR